MTQKMEESLLKNESLGETMEESLNTKFGGLKNMISSMDNKLIPKEDNTIRSFDANENSVRVTTIGNDTIKTTVLYQTSEGFYYYHSDGNISEFEKVQNPQKTEEIINEIYNEVFKVQTDKNIALQKKNDLESKMNLKHAEEYLDIQLQKIKD